MLNVMKNRNVQHNSLLSRQTEPET